VKVKPFVGHTTMVPPEWAQFVGKMHHYQIDVLAYAANRADLATLCIDLGDTSLAKQLTHPGPRSGIGIGNGWQAFLDACPEPGRGIYIARDAGMTDAGCFRVNDDGTFTLLGRWVRTDRWTGRCVFDAGHLGATLTGRASHDERSSD
jgi:hypothetical protein